MGMEYCNLSKPLRSDSMQSCDLSCKETKFRNTELHITNTKAVE